MILYKLIIHATEADAAALHVTHVRAAELPRRDESLLFELDGATLLLKVTGVVHDIKQQRNPDEVQCPVTDEVIAHAQTVNRRAELDEQAALRGGAAS